MPYTLLPLDDSTWDVFADLVERNNGIFGGCWCIGYHPECGQKGISHRAAKEDRVRTDRAHAALVLDEDGAAQGWCQYGSPEELPNIKHRREYDKDAPPLPDWRITCHLRGDRRPPGPGPVPVQRDCRAVRGLRVHAGPPGREACLDRDQDG